MTNSVLYQSTDLIWVILLELVDKHCPLPTYRSYLGHTSRTCWQTLSSTNLPILSGSYFSNLLTNTVLYQTTDLIWVILLELVDKHCPLSTYQSYLGHTSRICWQTLSSTNLPILSGSYFSNLLTNTVITNPPILSWSYFWNLLINTVLYQPTILSGLYFWNSLTNTVLYQTTDLIWIILLELVDKHCPLPTDQSYLGHTCELVDNDYFLLTHLCYRGHTFGTGWLGWFDLSKFSRSGFARQTVPQLPTWGAIHFLPVRSGLI